MIEYIDRFLKWRESLGKNVHSNLYHHGMSVNDQIQGPDMWSSLALVILFWMVVFIGIDLASGSNFRKFITRKIIK
jgi:hypothetical protein